MNPKAAALARAAAAGITATLATPGGDGIRGQSALVFTALGSDVPQIGALADERRSLLVIKTPVALHVGTADRPAGGDAYPNSLMGLIAFNRQAFFEMFDSWANELRPTRPEVSGATWESFKKSMYGGEFLFNVSREFVSRCQTPLLVLLGNDLHHPQSSSREVAALAPNATLIEFWKEPEHQPAAKKAVEEFLAKHTPR